MPKYNYIAKSLTGEPRTGNLEAKDKSQLARILRQQGFILISADTAKKGKRKFKFSLSLFGKISLAEKLMFARNLKVMVGAGISLPRAFRTLSSQAKSKKFKRALIDISEEITKGRSFSDAIVKYPNIFSELFVSMIRIGEEAGKLDEVLGILAQQIERTHQLRSKVKGAMIYPLVIISVMVIIGVVMLVLVVPKLAQTFEELEVELPLTTRMIITIGSFLGNFWYLLPVIFLILLFLLRLALKTEIGRRIKDTIVLRIPVISPIIKKTNSAYTTRNLSSLISSGVPLVRSLEVVSHTLGNIYYKEALLEAAAKVKKGSKLSQALIQHQDIYSPLVIQMTEVGEETGQTSEILEKLAQFFEEEVGNATKNLASVIEPALMVIVGAAVGFFAVSMIQPIYSMLGAIK